MPTVGRVLSMVCGLLWVSACSSGAAKPAPVESAKPAGASAQTQPEPAKVLVYPPGRPPVTVKVELAVTAAQRQRGLMFRRRLEADAGMLFLWKRPQHLSFWMRNTDLPLDIIFIEPDLKILGIVENAEPHTDAPREVPGLSQYVLEVNAGFARRHGLGVGTRVRFVNVEVHVP